jgi:hypothetical protein
MMAVSLAIAGVLVGGCALGEVMADYPDPAHITNDDVVGRWCNTNDRFLDFSDAGIFTATNFVPRGTTNPVAVDGAGTWQLAEDATGVVLTFATSDGEEEIQPTDLDAITVDGGDVWLSSYSAGDGGGHIDYERCPT